MIGRLAGRLDYRSNDHVLVDVGGVGYTVYVSEPTLAKLPQPGDYVVLYTELVVREDLMQLYGFTSPLEKEWHRLLMTVQGVGAKASMAILGALGASGISRAISIGDWDAIKAAPGVGPKIAQRVVNELKDKAPRLMALGGTITTDSDPLVEDAADADVDQTPSPAPDRRDGDAMAQAEALSALSNLGYSPSEAARAVAEAAGAKPDSDTNELIRSALRLLAPKG